MEAKVRTPGYGIYYNTFYPESGPSPDDGETFIDWVETLEEARNIVDSMNCGDQYNHHTFQAMNRPVKLPHEEYEEQMAKDQKVWEEHQAGLITDAEFNNYFYGEDQ
ncbi:hypothetical protein AGMMS49944_03980 [Spirochaetia bacterium]|nr:hypothetical protein AGMMS49944_03980 [Spirochaetia bacterium]